jgi:hypothetical protein
MVYNWATYEELSYLLHTSHLNYLYGKPRVRLSSLKHISEIIQAFSANKSTLQLPSANQATPKLNLSYLE